MKIKRLLVIAPEYPADDLPKSTTPVVHYFCKEWRKMGVEVLVINYLSNFPLIYYSISRPFANLISSKEGFNIRTSQGKECEYVKDDVLVKRICMRKMIPHTNYSSSEIEKAVRKTITYCKKKNFIPDFILGHWFDPCAEIGRELKKEWDTKLCITFHGESSVLTQRFGKKLSYLLDSIDGFGYRSFPIQKSYHSLICNTKPGFICPSGIPDDYISDVSRNFTNKVSTFVFVGTLIKRKYPAEIVPAVTNVIPDKNFCIYYVGTGSEEKYVRIFAKQLYVESNIKLLGRRNRKEVVEILCKTDVLVMNSKNEAFGLVYLEAMAVGCIVIAALDEGFDGIIINGKNGFLCKAGDIEDLSRTIERIRNLSSDELNCISKNAINTARELTEGKVAESYLRYLGNIV